MKPNDRTIRGRQQDARFRSIRDIDGFLKKELEVVHLVGTLAGDDDWPPPARSMRYSGGGTIVYAPDLFRNPIGMMETTDR